MKKKVLITGCNGLVGLSVTKKFLDEGYYVIGIDNNARKGFFGQEGSTDGKSRPFRYNPNFVSWNADIRDYARLVDIISGEKPIDCVVHCAAQPAHTYEKVFEDFEINAGGTLNVLEAIRHNSSKAAMVNLSTNKVYADNPNKIPMKKIGKRFEFIESEPLSLTKGVNEFFPIDHAMHSPFGCSKTYADLITQEYGRYFGLKTVNLRCGCLTGPNHSGVRLHGFLNYLVKCIVTEQEYTIEGYSGFQVRDNLHADDLANLIFMISEKPPEPGTIFNVGGGKENSVSILEAVEKIEEKTGKKAKLAFNDTPRKGDHICYYTDLTKIRDYYPDWKINYTIDDILNQIIERYSCRQ